MMFIHVLGHCMYTFSFVMILVVVKKEMYQTVVSLMQYETVVMKFYPI
jgi:hypothetical protein